MASVETLLSESDIQKKRRRNLLVSIILGVIILHVGAGVIAGIFVVAKYIFPPPANFVVKKDIRLPAKKREHKMNMAALDAAAPKPTFSDRMQSTRPTAFSLPDLPQMPLDQVLPLDPSQLVADNVSSLAAADGIGTGGMGSAGAAGFGKSGLDFLGVKAEAKRMVVAIDVSGSVAGKAAKTGTPMDKIREKFIETIDKFSINSRFGIILFSRAYIAFSPDVQTATPQNKENLKTWAQEKFPKDKELLGPPNGKPWSRSGSVRGNPDGIEAVLNAAFAMKPDVLIIISDGDFQRSGGGERGSQVEWDEIRKLVRTNQETLEEPAKIFFVGFEMKPEHLREARSLCSSTGGKLSEIK